MQRGSGTEISGFARRMRAIRTLNRLACIKPGRLLCNKEMYEALGKESEEEDYAMLSL
jgi:hypothetical protein